MASAAATSNATPVKYIAQAAAIKKCPVVYTMVRPSEPRNMWYDFVNSFITVLLYITDHFFKIF